jgi:hypothetical protein
MADVARQVLEMIASIEDDDECRGNWRMSRINGVLDGGSK